MMDSRAIRFLVSGGIGVGIVILLSLILSSDGVLYAFLVGNSFPISEQLFMWAAFAIGLAEILQNVDRVRSEAAALELGVLPEDDTALLQINDLGAIHSRIVSDSGMPSTYLGRLIKRALLQFQASKSVDQANSILNSSIGLMLHEVDLRYSFVRYMVWILPTLGFIGTVRGIAEALQFAAGTGGLSESALPELIGLLSVAFYTTLLALVMSVVLVYAMMGIQAAEEKALNRSGQYCLDNLINRLLEH